jgi:lipid II isoglutaminyl synthase (glutamine-hydrolysing)
MSALGPKIAAARGVGKLARISGRGGGTSLPGKVLLRLDPHAIGALSARLRNGSAMISATNGKTTTAAMSATILERAGHRLVHNRSGANMAGGITSTLLAAARSGGAIDGDLGLFETDEFWVPQLSAELRPRALLLSNLFRDQLDRYGELETIADRWQQVVAEQPTGSSLVLNADDPLVADLGRVRAEASARVVYFGIEDDAVSVPELQHASDSKTCRNCGAAYVYEAIYLGHLGHYRCPACGQTRPEPQVSARDIKLHGTNSASFRLVCAAGERAIELPLPGLYNVYNALAAAALTLTLGATLDQVAAGLGAVSAAFGRAETISVNGIELQLMLIKNPAGANEVLRTLTLEPEPVHLLAILNDKIADGRDVSWVWDADWELVAGHLHSVICSGSRAAELAVRLKYAGVPTELLQVVPDLGQGLDATLAGADSNRAFALPTYTALLALRELLAERGHVTRYWERDA